MFLTLFPKLKDNKLITLLNKFLSSRLYIALVATLLATAEIFSLEFIIYYILIAFSIIIPSLLCFDMTALIPSAVMMHIAMSKKTFDENNTIVLGNNIVHFIIILVIVIIFMFGRLIFDLITNKDRRHHYPRFLIGFVVLGLAYIFGGSFTSYIDGKSMLFGLREILSICGFYFYFLYTIDWKSLRKDYFAYLFLFFGLAVSLEVWVFIFQGLEVTTGWGIRNDVGGTLAISIPASGYLTIKKRGYINWLYSLLLFYLLTVTALTESRGGTMGASIMVITSVIMIMVFSHRWGRIYTATFFISYIVVFTLLFLFQTDFMMKYFGRAFGSGLSFDDLDEFSSHRFSIWKYGLEQWAHHPILGVGWYQCNYYSFIYPARYHNTYVQLLSSTGIIGLLAYLFHRFETLYVAFKKPTLEKTFAIICIMALMAISLVDCHFFNIWLGFGYGFLLAFIEGRNKSLSN